MQAYTEYLLPIGNPARYRIQPSACASEKATDTKRIPTIVPFFIPFAGCPHRCLFCAQDKQTGKDLPQEVSVTDALAKLFSTLKKVSEESSFFQPVELAFYGGTFTALPQPLLDACMDLAQEGKASGLLCRIRCSTRPDALDPTVLQHLQHKGLDGIELGIQSFHDAPLQASQRGYTGLCAKQGCERVRDLGFTLGIQLLPGMPEHTPQQFIHDVQQALELHPAFLRFYPCLVVEGTPLATLWRQGGYSPWAQDTVVKTLGQGLALAWAQETPVIRLSLAPEPELEPAILAGARHPALGSLIQGEALLQTVEPYVRKHGCPPDSLALPAHCRGFAAGHQGSLRPRWQALGISMKEIQWIPGHCARLCWTV